MALEYSHPSLNRLERFARLLDDRFRIPGTRLRFGLDSLLGLVPGAGDAASMLLSTYILWNAWRMGVSRSAWIKMAGNVLLDAVAGSIPLLGDIFDIAWKANRRNLHVLRNDLFQQKKPLAASGKRH